MRKVLEACTHSIHRVKKPWSEISLVKQLSVLFVFKIRNIKESKVMQCQFYFLYKKHKGVEIPLVMIKMIAAFYNKYILLLFKLKDYFK